ncbi:hypothetical protein GCM10009817_30760 [Terrabacter lapilli]|uniref:Uncharacterized protein n=1 Tax=Terrabacter lapilli TaxID=436231 RepID=A0ABN2SIH2_9MICO
MAAGYPCPSWGETNSINKASESGICSDSDVFSTYTSEANRDEVVDTLQSGGLSELSLLVGPNWIINGKGAPALQPRLGGTVVNSDTPRVYASSDTPAPPAATFEGKAADFQIGIKILRKKCFGSAGCNVTYRIDPKYVGLADIPDTGTIEVTYAVKGFEDGEAVNTFTIEDGQASFDSEERGTVPSSGTKLSARATDVSYTP